MGTLRALIDQASDLAEGMFDPADVLMPHLIAEAADGGIVLVALAVSGPDLDMMRKAVAARFEAEGHRRWVFFSEGWKVEYSGGPSRGDPQDDPERIEVVQFDAFDVPGQRRVRASRQILRSEGEVARLLPLVISRARTVDFPTRPPRGAA